MHKNFYEEYYDNYVLRESKDRLIDKLSLTDEQKQTLKDFFKRHPSYENRIDWNNKNLTWEDFQDVLNTLSKSETKRQIRSRTTKGLESLVAGRDYEVIDQQGTCTLYKILTYEAMCIIASNDVAPQLMSEIPSWAQRPENEWYDWWTADTAPSSEPVAPGAHWCIAMKKTKAHWTDYAEQGYTFYVLTDTSRTDKLGKICCFVSWESFGREDAEVWDANDDMFDLSDYFADYESSGGPLSKDAYEILKKNKLADPVAPHELQDAVLEYYKIELKPYQDYNLPRYKGFKTIVSYEEDENVFGGTIQTFKIDVDGFGEDTNDDWTDFSDKIFAEAPDSDLLYDLSFYGGELSMELHVENNHTKQMILDTLKLFDQAVAFCSKFKKADKITLDIKKVMKKHFGGYYERSLGTMANIEGHLVAYEIVPNKKQTVLMNCIGKISPALVAQAKEYGTPAYKMLEDFGIWNPGKIITTAVPENDRFITARATITAKTTEEDLDQYFNDLKQLIKDINQLQ